MEVFMVDLINWPWVKEWRTLCEGEKPVVMRTKQFDFLRKWDILVVHYAFSEEAVEQEKQVKFMECTYLVPWEALARIQW